LNLLRIEASAVKRAEERKEERGRAEEKIEMAKEMLRDTKPIERIVKLY